MKQLISQMFFYFILFFNDEYELLSTSLGQLSVLFEFAIKKLA